MLSFTKNKKSKSENYNGTENTYHYVSSIKPFTEAIRISITYGLIGVLWILLSDEILLKLAGNISLYKKIQTYKGWVYVLITMALIYSLVVNRLKLLKNALIKLANNYEELNAANEQLAAFDEELRQQFDELEAHRNALLVSEERYELAVNGADCGIWDWDVEKNIYYFSPTWKHYLYYEDNEISNSYESWENLLHPEDKDEAIERLKAFMSSSNKDYESTYRMKCKDGSYRWILSKAKAIRNSEGKVTRIAGSHTDITEQKNTETKLYSLAYYDKLSDLPNRFLFEKMVTNLIDNNKDKQFALLYIDVDNFKNINDFFGHSVGDQLLKNISDILKSQIKFPNLIARLGGDEFGIIFTGVNNTQEIISELENLLNCLKKPWLLDKQEFFISFSIGIAIYPQHGVNLSALLKNSDIAMYCVKKSTKDNYCFYNPQLEQESLEQIKMLNYIRKAIDNKEFNLVYQPIINLKDEKLIEVEALLRWNHPILGTVSPMDFIPLAEESGLIYYIDKWVLNEALKQKKQWEEKNYPNIKISINISGKNIDNSNFTDELKLLLKQLNIKSEGIQFEVTETALMDNIDNSIKFLKDIRDIGINIALDDFGTGYSSLTYLKNLPIDIVKLDRTFINSISSQSEDAIIVQYIIELVHELKMKIVAEGIEKDEELTFLKGCDCDYGQGYLFSKPISKEAVEELLESMQP